MTETNNQHPTRRLVLGALTAAGVWLARPVKAVAGFIRGRFPVRTVDKRQYRFDPASGDVIWTGQKRQPYRLVIDGLVEEPISLTYAELKALPQAEQTSDFHCVEGWSVPDLKWGGFRFKEIMARVKVKPEAKWAILHSLGHTSSQPQGLDHYLESLPLPLLLDPAEECIMALRLDGKPIPAQHGAPLRLIAPFQLAYKSIKFVERIEFAAEGREGWWSAANPIYPVGAPVPKRRLRRPKGSG